jgi:hypothetical protein
VTPSEPTGSTFGPTRRAARHVYGWRARARSAGHEGAVALGSEGELVATLGLALVLGEAIEDFTPHHAERAILGVSALLAWSVRGDDAGGLPAAQLGPVLVTPDELGELGALRGALVSGSDACRGALLDGLPPLGELLAYLAARVPLRAGDLVSFAPSRGGLAQRPHGPARAVGGGPHRTRRSARGPRLPRRSHSALAERPRGVTVRTSRRGRGPWSAP